MNNIKNFIVFCIQIISFRNINKRVDFSRYNNHDAFNNAKIKLIIFL